MKNKNTYVVFGFGVIGDAIFRKLSDATTDYRIFAFDHSRVDITQRDQIRPVLRYIKPTVVINCAGVSNPDECESSKSGCHTVNAISAGLLAEECNQIKAKIVQMSSPFVYGEGKFDKTFSERHKCKPVNVIGRTKLDAEVLVKESAEDYLIIRMGTLFSNQKSNMLTDCLNNVGRGINYCIQENSYVSPIYAPDLADATMNLIEKDAQGVFNVANSGETSIGEFVDTALSLCSLNTKRKVFPSELSKTFSAPRPQRMTLACEKYNLFTDQPLRHWKDALIEGLAKMGRYKA